MALSRGKMQQKYRRGNRRRVTQGPARSILFDPLLLESLPSGASAETPAVEPEELPPSSPRRRKKYTPHGPMMCCKQDPAAIL